jgi:hypothetical protein
MVWPESIAYFGIRSNGAHRALEREVSMGKQRRKLVHFLAVDTLDPLCGGDGGEPTNVAVNGVSVCPGCAERMSEQVERPPEHPPLRSPLRRWGSARRPARP